MTKVWLNYHHLFYFKTIATEGSIAKASKILRLGQPTLSAQLKLLEDTLGHQLFERQKRSLILTDVGRLTLDYANEIFRLGNELLEAINDRPVHGRAAFHVGILDNVPKHVSVQVLEAANQVGDCLVTIHEGKGNQLLRELKDHQLDLVLLNYAPPVQDASRLKSRKIARVPVTVCGAKKFSHLTKQFPESMNGQPFIMPTPDSQLRHSLDHWFSASNINVEVICEAQDTSLNKLLAIKGFGLVALAGPAVAEHLENKELFQIGEFSQVFEEYWIVSADRRVQNPVTAKLMRSLSL